MNDLNLTDKQLYELIMASANDEFDPNYMTDIECLDFIIDVLKFRLNK